MRNSKLYAILSSMFRIYCDNGGYLLWLRQFDVEIVQFPYENVNRKITDKVAGSEPTWDQTNLTWDQANFTWNDMEHSEKFGAIQKLLKRSGGDITVDAQQIDAAYRSRCDIFVTSDKADIMSRKTELTELLGIKFFHTTEDETELRALLEPFRKNRS